MACLVPGNGKGFESPWKKASFIPCHNNLCSHWNQNFMLSKTVVSIM